MVTQRFQDDFNEEFRAEQAFLNAQASRFEALSATLRSRSFRHFLSAGFLVFLEILCYLAAFSCFALFFFRNQLYPFYLLARFDRPEYTQMIGTANVANVKMLVWVLLAIIAVLCIVVARNLRNLRIKNAALARTGSVVKGFLGDLLQRKAAFQALEQRYYHEIPMIETHSSISSGTNEIPNPGYDNGLAQGSSI